MRARACECVHIAHMHMHVRMHKAHAQCLCAQVRRHSLRMVVFTDGETRCVPFTADTCWRDWTFAWQWEARKAALLAKPEPQQRALPPVVGRRLFFKVDGRAWREVELQKPCSAAQWERLQAHLEQEEDGVTAGGAPSPDGSERGADGAPTDPPRKGGDSQGKGSKALRKTEKEKPKAAGAAAKGAAAKGAAQQQQQQQEGRGGWWQARCTEVPGQPMSDTAPLLIRVTAATQWEQWAPEAEAGSGEGGKGGEQPRHRRVPRARALERLGDGAPRAALVCLPRGVGDTQSVQRAEARHHGRQQCGARAARRVTGLSLHGRSLALVLGGTVRQ